MNNSFFICRTSHSSLIRDSVSIRNVYFFFFFKSNWMIKNGVGVKLHRNKSNHLALNHLLKPSINVVLFGPSSLRLKRSSVFTSHQQCWTHWTHCKYKRDEKKMAWEMYVLFTPPAECLRCDESRCTKSDTETFGWPTAAISDIRMSFQSPMGEICFHTSAMRPLKTALVQQGWTALFTSSTCLEGILKAESWDFPYLKCPLTLATVS